MFNFFRRKKSTETTPIDEASVIEAIDNTPSEADATLALNEAAIAPIAEPLVEESLSEAATDAPTFTPTANPTNAAANDDSAPEIKTSLADIFNRALDDQLAQIPAAEPIAEHDTQTHEERFIAPQPETQEKPSAEQFSQRGWLARLRAGLSKTGTNLRHVFVGVRVDEALFESLEDALLMADVGVNATEKIMTAVRARVKKERIEDAQGVRNALQSVLIELLRPLEKELDIDAHRPLVLMVAGVNGAGKTTSIGKLTHHLQAMNKKIILAAGDTFRAAAREQLAVWGERNNVTVIAQESGDPAAVVFDAIASAQAKQLDVVIADTAGRLPTQLHLMDELKKVKRVADKALPGAPHEIILVLDGNMGQNALAQVKAFDEAIGLTGLIITKLDGTAKGGVLAALAVERNLPVYFIGVGEGVQDLQTFDAEEFAQALLGD